MRDTGMGRLRSEWIVVVVVSLIAMPAQAVVIGLELGETPGSADFTYLGGSPTKWDPGANTASFHGFVAPAGPMTPGAASWSVMPAGTLSDAFDGHGGAGTPTVGGGAGTVIVGAGAGSELVTYSTALGVWAAASGFTDLGVMADAGSAFNTPEPGPGNTLFGDIRIGTIGIDGAGSVLAHAYQPGTAATFAGTPTIGGDAHFDSAETWIDVVAGGAGGFDYFSVVLHELGHTLGLGHSSDASAVMYPFISADTAKRTLTTDDLAGITALYGYDSDSPTVPDGGSTIMLLGMGVIALGRIRLWRRSRCR